MILVYKKIFIYLIKELINMNKEVASLVYYEGLILNIQFHFEAVF